MVGFWESVTLCDIGNGIQSTKGRYNMTRLSLLKNGTRFRFAQVNGKLYPDTFLLISQDGGGAVIVHEEQQKQVVVNNRAHVKVVGT
jgi:hypothetical protein